jgi:hypothetical protein
LCLRRNHPRSRKRRHAADCRVAKGAASAGVTHTGRGPSAVRGLLRCNVCDAHYTITNATSYGCSGYHDGRACGNSILVRRDRVENILLGPIRDDLLKPDRVARMAKEMQGYFSDRVQAIQARATEAPRELEELEARIGRLRDRLKHGDPDMPEDELQAAIDRADEKRRELQEQLSAYLPAIAFVFMSRAAELGLDGNPQAALKARVFLREWFRGKSGWSHCRMVVSRPTGIRTLARF